MTLSKAKKSAKAIKSRIWEMKEGEYTKALAKIQVGAIFHAQEIRRFFYLRL